MSVIPLSAYDAAAMGVETGNLKADAKLRSGIKGKSLVGSVDSPASQVSNLFTPQSYFDNTLLQQAILAQPPNEAIVASTAKEENADGYSVGLHPSSETPIAIKFKTGGQQGQSSVYTLKPGQTLTPQGIGFDGEAGKFSGFKWGLPFGWLGGGSATLVVMRTHDAKVNWLDRSEIIFQRQRIKILAPADVPASTALPYNWPSRFPWSQAVFGSNNFSQRGRPSLAVTPTRTTMMLRLANLAATATMRAYFIGTDSYAIDSTGAVSLTDAPPAIDVVWGTWASIASANYATQYQSQILTGESERYVANGGAVVFVSSDSSLQGQYVDVVRYGKL